MGSDSAPVVIVGGGIGGLCLALTCDQLGLAAVVLEAVERLAPLGVGINLQPNAVRELEALGLGDELAALGVATGRYNMYSKHGGLIWSEPRGLAAGYQWPQYSAHRGQLQMMLVDAVRDRLGADAVRTSSRMSAYRNDASGASALVTTRAGGSEWIRGSVVIGADGIHSTVRAQMHPAEGEPKWSGRILWRATTVAEPYLDGATMVLSGHEKTKFVSYPISPIDPATGKALLNWIAQLTFELADGYRKEDYTRQASVEDFLPSFDGWSFAWNNNVEALIRGAERIYEYPMVDRDPLTSWTDGRVTLLGDAAHVMYPVGSNGASCRWSKSDAVASSTTSPTSCPTRSWPTSLPATRRQRGWPSRISTPAPRSSLRMSERSQPEVAQKRSLVRFFAGTLNGASSSVSNWASSGCFGSFRRCR